MKNQVALSEDGIQLLVERGITRAYDFIPPCPICGTVGGKDIATGLLFYRCDHWVGYYLDSFAAEDIQEGLQNRATIVLEIRHEGGVYGFPEFSEWYFHD